MKGFSVLLQIAAKLIIGDWGLMKAMYIIDVGLGGHIQFHWRSYSIAVMVVMI